VSRYRFIEVEKVNHAVRTLCRVLQVSRTAYYQWSLEPLSARAQADIVLTERIAAIHARSQQTYGASRVHAELHVCRERHGRKRVARLMRSPGLAGRVPRRYRRTTIGDPFTVLPDLVQRDFTPTHPDQLWVGDITYIRTWEGWLYLAAVLDCFSRRVVGWAMADHLRTELPLRALEMALTRRTPTDTLIHHTDRGCQYTSEAYTNVLESHGIRSSLSRPGNCWDNAVAESFFLHPQARPPVPAQLANSRCRQERGLRVHRGVLQPRAPPLDAGQPQSGRLRIRPRAGVFGLTKRVRQSGAGPRELSRFHA
jgi:putative transposase